mgnify:CR=1 FL=1
MTKTWKEYKTKYPKVRHRKVEKAIMFATQRAQYFLASKIDSDFQETASELTNGILRIYSAKNHDLYFKLFELDAYIRITDDLIDEDILTRNEFDPSEIKTVIKNFSNELPEADQISQLFSDELSLLSEKSKPVQERTLLQIMSNRTSDIDLIIEKLVKDKGTALSEIDLQFSKEFLAKWHIMDSIITDLWYIKQDKIKNDFNLFLKAKNFDLSLDFIKDNLKETIAEMGRVFTKIAAHPYKSFLQKALSNAENLSNLVYIPLIDDYAKSEGEWYQSLISLKLL